MAHRYGATAIGVLMIALVGAGGCGRGAARRRGLAARWAWLTLLWVCLQGAFGA